MCLGIIQDILFDNVCVHLGVEELTEINKILLETQALHALPAFRFELQLIHAAFLHSDEDDALKQDLIIDETLLTDCLVPMLRSFKDTNKLQSMLIKLKGSTNIAENRHLFRKHGILPCLGTLMEQYADSAAESVIAELIYLLLSDAPDAEMVEEDINPIAMFEEFMTVVYEG